VGHRVPDPARIATDPITTTVFPLSSKRAPPLCGHTYRGIWRCPAGALRRCPNAQSPTAPGRIYCANPVSNRWVDVVEVGPGQRPVRFRRSSSTSRNGLGCRVSFFFLGITNKPKITVIIILGYLVYLK